MNAQELSQLIQEVNVATGAYVASLPDWVPIWMEVMKFSVVPALFFMIRHAEARVIVVVAIYGVFTSKLMNLATGGPSLLWGVGHILFWPWVLVYVGVRFKKINWPSIYGVWLALVCLIMIISLIFDVRDLITFFSS